MPHNYSGYVVHIQALPLAEVALEMGAGRKRKTDILDMAAGVELLVKRGEHIEQGQPWLRVHHDGRLQQVCADGRQGKRDCGCEPDRRNNWKKPGQQSTTLTSFLSIPKSDLAVLDGALVVTDAPPPKASRILEIIRPE